MALANQAKTIIKTKLGKKRLFYITKDAERAEAGLIKNGPKNFYIITNQSDKAEELKKSFPDQIIAIKSNPPKNSLELLRNKKIKKLFKPNDFAMFFKTTELIEKECQKMNLIVINPPAKTASKIEEKLSQVLWLKELKNLLPKTRIEILKDVKWQNNKFILQFNRAHTGSGTILVDSAKQLKQIQSQFPNREARIARYIKGPIITSNNIINGKKVIIGNISYQITGLFPFTDNCFATIGNDWNWPAKTMNAKQKKEYSNIVRLVGKKLITSGWKGLFGIDAVIDEKTGKIFLIEINARQPASTSFESFLQNESKKNGLNTFFAHLFALLNIDLKIPLIKIDDGAQIIQRVTETVKITPAPKHQNSVAWKYNLYNNTKTGEDLMRVQTNKGIIAKHNEFNEYGNEISIFISMAKSGRIFGLPRAGMIIIRDNKILLIKRHRYNFDYWVMPGGTVEKNENPVDTARREIMEETCLDCQPDKKIKPIIINGSKNEIYYFAKYCDGKPRLGGPEKQRNNKANHYQLKWVELKQIKKINLLPPILKKELLARIKNKK